LDILTNFIKVFKLRISLLKLLIESGNSSWYDFEK